MLDLARFLDQVDGPAALVGPDGQTVNLPEEAFRVLGDVVRAMRLGKAIAVAPVDQQLTAQEAAATAACAWLTCSIIAKPNDRSVVDGGHCSRAELVLDPTPK